MFEARYAALVAAGLAMLSWDGLRAHDPGAGGHGARPAGPLLAVAVRVDPSEPVPPVVTVPLGAHVRLSVTGTGDRELHLHGYDVEAQGGAGPAVLAFHAAHEGRFPLESHVEDDLLGRRGKPVLFVEVRGP